MGEYYRSHSRRRRRGGPRRSLHGFSERRRQGWGMGLYRNRREGRICGVAAGLADWVVRLMFVGAFLFTGTLALWGYVAGAVLLSPRPQDRSRRDRERDRRERAPDDALDARDPANDEALGPELEYDERYHDYRPRRMFRYSESAGIRLARARERLDAAVSRVEAMERYVTSRRFRLNSELSRL